MNPFRCQPQTSQGSRLLLHSILALCCRHLDRLTGSWSTEAARHRSKAVQLLEQALQNGNEIHLLEPILIMFTLDVIPALHFSDENIDADDNSARCPQQEPGRRISHARIRSCNPAAGPAR